MSGRNVDATTRADQWSFQENYVERLMDNAAFTAAHPNNTLVLAGPARFPNVTDRSGAIDASDLGDNLLPIGMLQNMRVQQQRQVQPLQALGSARTFFTAGKSDISFSMSRLMINGRNLLRALYTQAAKNIDNVDLMNFGEPPVRSNGEEQFFLNLDSELFYIPIGLAVLFRSVAHDAVGAFYIELAMFGSWSVGYQAGQSVIMENVSGYADRIRPIFPGSIKGGPSTGNHPGSFNMADHILKEDGERARNVPPDLGSR